MDLNASKYILEHVRSYITDRHFPTNLLINNLKLKIKVNQTSVTKIEKLLTKNKEAIDSMETETLKLKSTNSQTLTKLRNSF